MDSSIPDVSLMVDWLISVAGLEPREIRAKLGVGQTTFQRCKKGDSFVSPATRRRVLDLYIGCKKEYKEKLDLLESLK